MPTNQPALRVAFLPAHPSQLWMLRAVADHLAGRAEPVWILRDKDVLLALADHFGLAYRVLSKASPNLFRAAFMLLTDTLRVWRLSKREHLDAWVTKYGPGNLGARLRGLPTLSFNDDDADVVPLVAWTSYPFAHRVLATRWTRMGRFEPGAIHYPGFHELFYLHPNRFSPDPAIRGELGLGSDEPFALIRLSALTAHHDVGVRGVDDSLLAEIVRRCANHRVRPVISGERPLSGEFEPYRFRIPAHRIHHALAAATLFVGDSQTMTAEAAVLGTPALRLNDFVGRIGYLAELERRALAFGYRPDQTDALLAHIESLLTRGDAHDEFARRRARLLAECPDPVPWFAEQIMTVIGEAPR
ncbi:MAG: hypothetical protein H6926_04360 [Chromatiales bacterium]|nr:hypothetical protein [Chromatiales bacterium]